MSILPIAVNSTPNSTAIKIGEGLQDANTAKGLFGITMQQAVTNQQGQLDNQDDGLDLEEYGEMISDLITGMFATLEQDVNLSDEQIGQIVDGVVSNEQLLSAIMEMIQGNGKEMDVTALGKEIFDFGNQDLQALFGETIQEIMNQISSELKLGNERIDLLKQSDIAKIAVEMNSQKTNDSNIQDESDNSSVSSEKSLLNNATKETTETQENVFNLNATNGDMVKVMEMTVAQPLEKTPFISKVLQEIQATLQEGNQGLYLKLKPDNLGNVAITLQATSEGIVAKIAAESLATRGVLAAELQNMENTLRESGVNVIEISLADSSLMQDAKQNTGDNSKGQSDNKRSFSIDEIEEKEIMSIYDTLVLDTSEVDTAYKA